MTDAAGLVADSHAVLLDFDGPITPLMPAPVNVAAADTARRALERAGVDLPGHLKATSDHLAILRQAARHGSAAVRFVEQAVTAAEVEAAGSCEPAPGAHEFIIRCASVDKPVVIVSNNAASAVETYLRRWDLDRSVTAVLGRPWCQPELMKPDPYNVRRALWILGVSAEHAVFTGDSLSDVEVARTVRVPVIGYAKRPERVRPLVEAHADAVILDMADLGWSQA